MENFIYYTPTKVYFGKGEENNVGKIIKEYHPKKVLIHYGKSSVIKSGLLDRVKAALDAEGISYIELGGVQPNPTLKLVNEGIALCQKEGVDFVLAIGGGSVIDSAKGIANGVNSGDDVFDYALKKKKPHTSLRKGAILTIAAAGSEMSDSSVITNEDIKKKSGYNSPFNRLDFAICNPELTYSVSKYQTACGVVDIAMHSIERFFTKSDEDAYLTDDLALTIIKDTFKYGLIAYNEPTNYVARANIMWASSLSHNGLTHMGKPFLLTVHQLEHTVSALYTNVAHGAGLAALWCSWARYCYKENIAKFYEYALKIWDIEDLDKEKAILEAITKQENYYKEIGMPTSLRELGVKESDLEYLALQTSNNKSRIIPGYKPLGYQEILDIFKLAY